MMRLNISLLGQDSFYKSYAKNNQAKQGGYVAMCDITDIYYDQSQQYQRPLNHLTLIEPLKIFKPQVLIFLIMTQTF